MLQIPVAKVAVLAATFAFDRPYTYKIPQPLTDTLRPGCRVMVPFSRGNRPCEGMVLALDKAEDEPKLKPITRQLDPEPILSPELIRLAVWMHDRFFCTIYDALHAILPAGVWYRVSTVYCAAPELDAAAALAQCGRSKQRRLALETVLEHGGRCPLDELQAAFGDKEPASAPCATSSWSMPASPSRWKRRRRRSAAAGVRRIRSPFWSCCARSAARRPVKCASLPARREAP